MVWEMMKKTGWWMVSIVFLSDVISEIGWLYCGFGDCCLRDIFCVADERRSNV